MSTIVAVTLTDLVNQRDRRRALADLYKEKRAQLGPLRTKHSTNETIRTHLAARAAQLEEAKPLIHEAWVLWNKARDSFNLKDHETTRTLSDKIEDLLVRATALIEPPLEPESIVVPEDVDDSHIDVEELHGLLISLNRQVGDLNRAVGEVRRATPSGVHTVLLDRLLMLLPDDESVEALAQAINAGKKYNTSKGRVEELRNKLRRKKSDSATS